MRARGTGYRETESNAIVRMYRRPFFPFVPLLASFSDSVHGLTRDRARLDESLEPFCLAPMLMLPLVRFLDQTSA